MKIKVLKNLSIKNKLMGIILLISWLAVGVGFTFVIIRDIVVLKKKMVTDSIVNARLISEYCVSPLDFGDKEGVEDILKKLETIPSIVVGCIYDENGEVFGLFKKSEDEAIPSLLDENTSSVFKGNYLHIQQPIIYRNHKYGTIRLKVSTAHLDDEINRHLLTMAILMIVVMALCYFLARRLQVIISKPILKLAALTEKISRKTDYSLRVEKQGNDEIGVLYDGFNHMLDQIQMRKQERDKAEAALRESEEIFRKIFESSNDAMMLLDENEFLDCNNRTLKVFGCTSNEDFLGKHPSEISPPKQAGGKDSRQAADERITEAFREGSCFFEWTHRRINGEDFPAEVLLTPIEIKGRKVIQATVRDITERKKMEEMLETASNKLKEYSTSLEKIVKLRTCELEEKAIELGKEVTIRKKIERKLRTEKAYIDQLFESAQEAIAMTDKDGHILRVNSEFIRLFGYTIAEVFRKSLDDLIAPKEYYDEAASVTMKVAEGKKVEFETMRRCKDEKLLYVSVLASPIIVDGELVASYGIYRDITKLKRAEKALEERSNDLAKANIRLKELDWLKSMFIASMSHELRTPLNSIIGFTDIILLGMSGEINEEQKKQLTLVKNSASHLLELINDVIDVSKIEAGKIDLVIEEFDLGDLVRGIKDSFAVALEEKGLKMPLKMPKRLAIESDQRRTKQIIMNLLSNAVKFTDKGKIAIGVEKKGERVKVSVRDTGVGIERKAMDKLFKPFSRIYTEGVLKEGTGLGLYLTRKMAYLLGGEMSAESEFGKGSKFTFTLPLVYTDEHR